jgi:hypothetical protein
MTMYLACMYLLLNDEIELDSIRAIEDGYHFTYNKTVNYYSNSINQRIPHMYYHIRMLFSL